MSEVKQINVYNDIEGKFVPLEVATVVDENGVVAFSAHGLRLALGELRGPRIISEDEPDIQFKCGLEVNTRKNTVGISGKLIPKQLTKTEFAVFKVLAESPEKLFSKRKITEILWQGYVDDHVVDVHFDKVRKALDARDGGQSKPGANAGLFSVVRGIGIGMGPRAFDPTPLVMPR